ncbi:hypothetical protein BH11ACT8_BH11ACT8_16460 [soil metagenome]
MPIFGPNPGTRLRAGRPARLTVDVSSPQDHPNKSGDYPVNRSQGLALVAFATVVVVFVVLMTRMT